MWEMVLGAGLLLLGMILGFGFALFIAASRRGL